MAVTPKIKRVGGCMHAAKIGSGVEGDVSQIKCRLRLHSEPCPLRQRREGGSVEKNAANFEKHCFIIDTANESTRAERKEEGKAAAVQKQPDGARRQLT